VREGFGTVVRGKFIVCLQKLEVDNVDCIGALCTREITERVWKRELEVLLFSVYFEMLKNGLKRYGHSLRLN
jgi:hypothetical protein